MMPPGYNVVVDVFHSGDLKGSPQHLHFFKGLKEMQAGYGQYQVNNEIDHSFVYLDENASAQVLWKNKAGRVQFCGSGAFALGWLITKVFESDEVSISFEKHNLHFHRESGSTYLEIPSVEVESVEKIESGDDFVDKNSGIYFLHLLDDNQLVDDSFMQSQLKLFKDKFLDSIHGFCVFTWKDNKGSVRYFTPWHGRDEDYVTGSIHQYLTPLVSRLFGKEKQEWVQRSSLGGLIHTSHKNAKVTMSGECSIASEFN